MKTDRSAGVMSRPMCRRGCSPCLVSCAVDTLFENARAKIAAERKILAAFAQGIGGRGHAPTAPSSMAVH